jgi:hypothetical protein
MIKNPKVDQSVSAMIGHSCGLLSSTKPLGGVHSQNRSIVRLVCPFMLSADVMALIWPHQNIMKQAFSSNTHISLY